MKPITRQHIMIAVEQELIRAQKLHGPMKSLHEAYAVIQEEVDEFWYQVKLKSQWRDPLRVRQELLHIAAMACRAMYDLRQDF